jgi:hypothetical protein
MTAATEGRMTKRRDGRKMSLPVAANTKLLIGCMVALSTTGVAVHASAISTLKVQGVAETEADNTGGAAGAIQVQIDRHGWFQFSNSAGADQITLSDVGSNCYVVDNQTVAKTSSANTRPVAGVIRDVETDGVWVSF